MFVVLGGDQVEKLLLMLKLLRSFGQGQVDRKENEVYCEFMSVEISQSLSSRLNLIP